MIAQEIDRKCVLVIVCINEKALFFLRTLEFFYTLRWDQRNWRVCAYKSDVQV